MQNFLSILDLDPDRLNKLLVDAVKLKRERVKGMKAPTAHALNGRHVGRTQARAQQLLAQVLLEADGHAVALHRVELVVIVVARRGFADAVEIVALGAVFPVVALGGAQIGPVEPAFSRVPFTAALLRVGGRFFAAGAVVALALELGAGRRVEGGEVFVRLEEGVLLEHLLDFLMELERGQLQQADGLLQLGREGQVLRQPELQGGLHVTPPAPYMRKCSPR